MNQTNMAASLNIKRPTLVGYENGLSPPSVDFLIKLRAVYKVNIDWLLTGNGKKFLSMSNGAFTDSDIIGVAINAGGAVENSADHGTVISESKTEGKELERTETISFYTIPLLTKEQVFNFDPRKGITTPKAYSGGYPSYTLVPIPMRFREYSTGLRAMIVFNNLMPPYWMRETEFRPEGPIPYYAGSFRIIGRVRAAVREIG